MFRKVTAAELYVCVVSFNIDLMNMVDHTWTKNCRKKIWNNFDKV